MFDLFKQNEVGEVVIIVLDGQFNVHFDVQTHIILGCPSKLKVSDLKTRIMGATGIPVERIMLLFCGQVLSDHQDQIPSDAFEFPETGDEDSNSFKARLCLSIMAAPFVEAKDDEDDINDKTAVSSDTVQDIIPKIKHKRKQKDKGEFNLVHELESVKCGFFASGLINFGYENEVFTLKGLLSLITPTSSIRFSLFRVRLQI